MNFAMKTKQLRQINQLKEAKLTTNLKQAENFADKRARLRPMKNAPIVKIAKLKAQTARQL